MVTQATDRAYATVNPYTNETVRQFDTLDSDQVDATVQRAHGAFQAWRLQPIEQRAEIVRRAGELMLERSGDLARLLTLEMGKLIGDSHWEVGLAASILKYYGEQGPRFVPASDPLTLGKDPR